MDTPAIDKVAAGKKASQKAVAEEATALLAKVDNAAKSKKNYVAKFRNTGRALAQKAVTTTVLGLTSLVAGRFHKSKAVSPAARMGVGLVLDVGGMAAELSGVKHANYIHSAGDGVFFSGLSAAAEKYGRDMADKAEKAAPAAPAEEKPPAGVSRPGQPRLPGASADDEDFVLTPKAKKNRREVVKLGRR